VCFRFFLFCFVFFFAFFFWVRVSSPLLGLGLRFPQQNTFSAFFVVNFLSDPLCFFSPPLLPTQLIPKSGPPSPGPVNCFMKTPFPLIKAPADMGFCAQAPLYFFFFFPTTPRCSPPPHPITNRTRVSCFSFFFPLRLPFFFHLPRRAPPTSPFYSLIPFSVQRQRSELPPPPNFS